MNQAKKLSIMLPLIALISLLGMSYCTKTTRPSKKVIVEKTTELNGTTVPEFKVYGSFNTKDLNVEKTLTVFGTLKGNGISCDQLIVHGQAEIERLDANTAVFFGSVSGKNLTFAKNLTVNGSVDLEGIIAPEKTILSGGINIKDGKLADIEVATTLAEFSNTTIGSPLVKKDHSDKKQIIELRQGSKISGDVTFEGGTGEVHLFDNSAVLGKVTGGKLVKKS